MKSFQNVKYNFLTKSLLRRTYLTRCKIDHNHWISYENRISIIGSTSKGQNYYKDITHIHFFVGVGQTINVKNALFGIEVGYFKDWPLMKNFSSPIEGIVEEININLIQNPISLIQSNESDA